MEATVVALGWSCGVLVLVVVVLAVGWLRSYQKRKDLTGSVQVLRGFVAARDEKLTKLQGEHNELRRELGETNDAYAEAARDHAAKVAELQGQTVDLEDRLGKATADLTLARASCESWERRTGDAESRLIQSNKSLETANAQCVRLERELRNAAATDKERVTVIDQQEQALATSASELAARQETITKLRGEVDKRDAELAALQRANPKPPKQPKSKAADKKQPRVKKGAQP